MKQPQIIRDHYRYDQTLATKKVQIPGASSTASIANVTKPAKSGTALSLNSVRKASWRRLSGAQFAALHVRCSLWPIHQ